MNFSDVAKIKYKLNKLDEIHLILTYMKLATE